MNCPGCWNPETHQHGIGEEVEPKDLMKWIKGLEGIDGVTFSGGEPMQQAPELFVLMRMIRTFRPELSIGMFTGYTRKELEEGKFHWFNDERKKMGDGYDFMWYDISHNLDFAVMGRYNQGKHTQSKALCGSSNQSIELLSPRYKFSDFQQQSAEITISADGQIVNITGFPSSHDKLKEGLCVEQVTSLPSVSPQRAS